MYLKTRKRLQTVIIALIMIQKETVGETKGKKWNGQLHCYKQVYRSHLRFSKEVSWFIFDVVGLLYFPILSSGAVAFRLSHLSQHEI